MKFIFVLFFLPLQIFAQLTPSAVKNLTGLWKGHIITDEIKVPYELVINEQNGNISGYSYTTFIVDGAEIVTMKKIRVKDKDGIIVEDEDNVYNNFPTALPKKIKQVNYLSLLNTTPMRLTGTFETKVPRSFKRASGTVFLEKKNSPSGSVLIAKLDDMKLMNTSSLSFDTVYHMEPSDQSLVINEKIIEQKPPMPKEQIIDSFSLVTPVIKKPEPVKREPSKPVASRPVIREIAIANRNKKDTASATIINGGMAKVAPAKTVVNSTTATVVPVPVPKKVVAKTLIADKRVEGKPVAINKKITVPVSKNQTVPVIAVNKVVSKPLPVNIAVAPAIDLAKRKIETIDQLYIMADSLQFTLYDNGEVDGDTVSVILNGKTIVYRQGLSTTAFTKTIYLTPDMGDSVQLVMYAETLGSIPPNTGLLILNFDKQRREVRFSGDLLKNAAITLRRKEKD